VVVALNRLLNPPDEHRRIHPIAPAIRLRQATIERLGNTREGRLIARRAKKYRRRRFCGVFGFDVKHNR
jgi:hypothetical protein